MYMQLPQELKQKQQKKKPPPPTTKQEKQPPSPQQKSKKATDYLTVHVIWGFVFKEEQFKECEVYVVFMHEYMLFFFPCNFRGKVV